MYLTASTKQHRQQVLSSRNVQHVPSQSTPVKTENSILELSLLLTSKTYDHIYRFLFLKKRVKINARGIGEEKLGLLNDLLVI